MLRSFSSAALAAIVAMSLSASGCGTSRGASSGPTTTAAQPPSTAIDATCPVNVPGTTVTVEDTATGAAFLFVTTGDPGQVRSSANALATMHNNMHRAMGALPDGAAASTEADGSASSTEVAAGGHHHHHAAAATSDSSSTPTRPAMPMGQMISVHSQANVTEMPQGARVDFVVSPTDVAKLQNELRMHAQHLTGGTCEM